MSRKLKILAGFLSLMAIVPLRAERPDAVGKGDAVVVPLQGEISPSLATFLRRAIKTAESAEAAAVVLDINTYGGRLDAAEDITNILNRAKVPTYSFINTNAGSAGSVGWSVESRTPSSPTATSVSSWSAGRSTG